MLYLDEPIYYINGLQIHRDFQNVNQFYYFPAAPRIHQENGELAFQLLKYARDVTDNPLMPPDVAEQVGGGFLVFTVDIGVDEEILEDTRRELAAFAEGEVMLAPVPFHTGTVRLIALGAEGANLDTPPEQPTNVFVEKVFGSTKPSLYGDNLAIFGLHLEQEGTTLLEDSFRHGGGLLGVVYDLTYAGIRPALQVKAKVDFERVYNRFEAKIGFQYAMIGAELEAQLEWLREQRAIEIEITQYDTDPETATQLRREAMELVKQEVLAKMLKPSLQVPNASTGGTRNLMDQVMRYAREFSRPASGATARPAPQPSRRTTEGDPGPTEMNAGEGARGQSGDAATGSGGRGGSPGFALTFSLKYVRQEERKTAEFDFRVNQAVSRPAAPQGSLRLLLEGLNMDDHIREVNLDDPFFNELKAWIGVTGNWEVLGIDKVVVNATYQPDPTGPIVHTDGWTFNASGEPLKPFNVVLDKNRPVRLYKYKTQVFLKDLAHVDSKERILEIEDTSEQRELLINPANEFRPLLVSVESGTIDWQKVPRVDVKLHYEDDENDFTAEQLFSFSSAQSGPYNWVLYPVLPPEDQREKEHRSYTVTYGYTVRDEQGNTTYFELEPEERTDEGIIVPPPFKGVRRVRLIPAVDKEEVQEVTADVLYESNGYRFYRNLVFEEGNFGTQRVEIPVPDPDPEHDSYKVRWSVLFSDFSTYENDWTDYQQDRVMLDDGLHSAQEVKVELTYTPSDVGLRSLLLTLESLNPAGEVVDTDKHMLKGAESTWTTNLSYLKDTPFRYRLSKTWFKLDNTRETIGPFESDVTELFVDRDAIF